MNTYRYMKRIVMREKYCVILCRSVLLLMLIVVSEQLQAQNLPLPVRKVDVVEGSEFKNIIEHLTLEEREKQIYQQIMSGNVPDFLRNLVPISFSKTIQDATYNVTYYVLLDYLSVGSEEDYFLIPMTPVLSQRIANAIDFTLPTKQMVDQIWNHASVKLMPSPITASPLMTTIPVMWKHNMMVKAQRANASDTLPVKLLLAGHKKDVIISNRIYGNTSKRVVIYGWHNKSGVVIQPVYAGHSEDYVDYSHGIRLVQDSVLINGQFHRISDVLQDDTKALLFSDEGVIDKPFYPLCKE